MKKNVLSLALLLFIGSTMITNAQVTGVKNIPGDYATLAAAITDLNTNGVGVGGATININANQTATSPGYNLGSTALYNTLSASNPLVINGNGNSISGYTGTKAGSATTATNDAILVLTGVDFVTIKKINFLDLAGNTTTTTCMDNGIGIYNAGTAAGSANGCQNILIDSCTFNLKNQSTSGTAVFIGAFVYSSGATSSWNPFGTTPGDMHRLITVSNCNFNEIYNGVVVRGSTSVNSQFVTISNNIFNNYGGGTTTCYGIYQAYHDHLTVLNNTFLGDLAHTTTNYAIFQTTNSGGVTNIEGNSINIRHGITTSQSSGIFRSTYVGGNYRVAKNTITATLPSITSGVLYPVYLSTYGGGNIHDVMIDSNTFENIVNASTGVQYDIYATGSATLSNLKIRGNIFRNNSRTGASGTWYPIYVLTNKSSEVSRNSFENLSFVSSGATTTAAILKCIYSATTQTDSFRIFNNNFKKLNISVASTGANTLTGIDVNIANNMRVYSNKMFNFKLVSNPTSTSSNRVIGILTLGNATNDMNIYSNYIDSFSSIGNPADPMVIGIYANGGSSGNSNIFNNIVRNLVSPNGARLDNIYGILATNSQSAKITFNTVYLPNVNSTSTSTFGGTGISIGSLLTNGSVQNNIVYVKGNGGPIGGAVSCFSVTTTGTAGTKPANLQNISNNIYYIDSGANNRNFIFAQGLDNVATPLINAYSFYNYPSTTPPFIFDAQINTACSAYKLWMGESGTFFENNLVTNSDSTMNPSGNSFAKNGAVNIANITSDYSGAIRPATADIGALQFSGINSQDLNPPSINYTNLPNLNCVQAPTLSTTITDVSGVNVVANKPRLYYKLHTEDNDTATLNNASSNGWKYVEATGTAPNFNFAIDFSKLTINPAIGDTLQYFVIAQDSIVTPNIGINNAVFPAGFCPTSVVLPIAAYPVSGFKSFVFNAPPDIMMSATPQTVCLNNNDTLVARLVNLGIGTIGSITGASTGTSPYNTTTTAGRRQAILYLASDLIAQGFQPGPITSIGWTVTSTTGFVNLPDFTIKMGHTNLSNPLPTTSVPATYGTGSSIVCVDYTSVGGYLPQTGLNMHTFTTPFIWDGVSNIIVETCLGATTTASSLTINYTGSMTGYNQYNTAAGSNCTIVATTTTNTFRPVITMIGNKQNPNGLTYSWFQGTNVIGTNNFTQYVQPNFPGGKDTMVYKVQITEALGCVHIDSIEVYKNTSLPIVNLNAFNTQTPCYGDSIKVNFSVIDGCPPYTISYKRSNTVGGATTPLTLSASNSFFPTGDKGYIYADVIDNGGNQINNFLVDSFDLPNEPIAIHDTLCGTGSLTLGATAIGPGTIYWFDKADPKSAILLGTSNTYNTPIISTTDTFYAGEGSLNFYNVFPGNTPTNNAASTTVNSYGIKLRIKDAFKLDSVSLRFTAALTNACAATFVKYDSISATVANNFVNGYDTFIINVDPASVTAAGVYHFAPDRLIQFNGDKIGTTVNIRPIAHNCANLNYYHYNAAGMFTTSDHISAAVDITGSTTTANYNVPNTYQYSYIYGIKGSKYCGSLLTPVVAFITAPPALTLNSYTIQICNPTTNTATDTIKLTSPLSNYSSYTWSTGTGSIIGTSSNGWIPTSAASSQDTFILTAVNASSGCQQIDTVFVNPVPFSTAVNISADLAVHCLSGSSKISLNGTPKTGATYQWQKSIDNGSTWSNISGSTFDTLQTGTIFDTLQYRTIISCNGNPITGGISPSPVQTIFVHNPAIDSVKHDTICGVGTADLQAFANTGNVQWYSKTGTYLGAGNTFTTPTLIATDTFIAKATTAPGAATSLVSCPTPAGPWTTNNSSNPIMFDLTPNVNITLDTILARTNTATNPQLVKVYYKLGTHNGFQLNAAAWTQIGGVGTTISSPLITNATLGNYLQIALPSGGLQLNAGQTYGIFVEYVSAYLTNPTPGVPQVYSNSDLTFTSGSTSSGPFTSTIADRVFVGKFIYKTGCQSSGTPVIATVTPPPALTISQIVDTVCSGQISDKINITAPSTLSTYNTYTWNTPDVIGTSSTGYNFNQTTPGSYKYILEAEQTSGLLCKNKDTFDFVVNRNPTAFNIDPIGPISQCNGSTQEIRATSGFVAFDTVGNGTTAIGSTTGNPYRNGAGSTTHRLQYLVTQAELSALSFAAGDFTSLAFKATSVNTGAISNYEIKMANTTATNLSTTFLNPTFTSVYSAASFGPAVIGWNTHTFSTPFTWNGTDNVLIELCYTTVSGTTANVLGGAVPGVSIPTIHATAATCGVTATGTTSASRPNIQFSQNNKYPITWSPSSGLFRNAATTIAYSGTNRDTVWAAPADTIMYFATATHPNGCTRKDSITINVVDTVSITTQPVASTLLCQGSPLNLNVVASSTSPITYQWRKGGSNITNTTSSIAIASSAVTDSGAYDVIVSTGTPCASKTSTVATVKVSPSITITTQPLLANVCQGQSFSLIAAATGDSSITWTQITGSNTSNTDTLSKTSASLSDSGMYFVTYKAFAPCANKNSDTVKVTVFPASFVSTDPVSTTVCQGTTATFTATGKNSVSVSWRKGTSALTAGGNIAINNVVAGDSTVSTLTITNASFSDTGSYRFVSVTGGSGCANDTSAAATLSINAKPTITSTTLPATTVCAGTTMSFAVTASNNSRVVWYGGASGTDSIQNATSFTLPATAGIYKVKVIGNSPCGDTTSATVTTTVTPLATITKPVILSNPICAGSTTTVSANFTNADSVVWFQGATRLGLGSVAGSTSTFTVSSAGTYTARAYSANGCINVDSTSNTLSINAKPTITSTTLPATTVCAGTTMSFAVTASNNSRVVWYGGASGTDSIQNATSFTLPATAGIYKVKVIGNSPCGDTTSATVTTTVTPLASITTQPSATTVCQGSAMSFTISASNADSVVWFRGTTRVGTGTTYSVSSATSADSANYSAIAYSASGCTNATSNVVLGAVKPQATITTQPVANTYVLTGGTASISVSASNFDSVVWYKGSTRVSNGTTLSITNFDSATHAGAYTARVYSNAPCTNYVSSSTANIIKSTCPVITMQPMGDTLCIGSTYTLSVTAGAVNTYEWYKVGNTTPIATTSSTSLNLSTLTSGGSYYVKLTPLTGCTTTVTSDTVKVGVDDSTRITAQPTASTTICEGSALNLSVTATGSGTISYQWMNGSTNVGTNSNSFSVSSAATSNAGTYKVVVSSTSSCPSATSNNATVAVTPAAVITTQPSSSTICEGSTLSFTIAATNADSIVWFRGSTRVGTGSTFSQTNAQTTNSGNYVAIAYRGAGCTNVSSNSVSGTVNAAPVITAQPASSAFGCNGSNFNSLSVVASNATSYQWKQGSTNKGGTSATISINPFTVSDTGNYTVVVSGTAPCADVTSTIANIKITDTAKIVTQPASLTDVCNGGTLKLSVVGNGAASYQWYKGSTAIAGETKDSLVIASVSSATAGTYKVEAIAFAGCVNTMSTNAVVTVSNPVTFTTQPAAQTICAGGTISLSTAVSGNSSPTYVWKKDGVALGAASSSSYSKSSALVSDSGSYTVDVTGASSCPTITSNVAKVTINAAPTISAISGTSPLCVGSTMTLSATATNNNGVIWKQGTTTVGTSSTYSKTAATSDAGSYTVTAIAKAGCTDVTSTVYTQAITSPVTITSQPVSTAVLTGTSFTLSVTASNANTYQWYKGTTAISGATSSSYTVSSFDSATDAGAYTVQITSNSPCTNTVTSNTANVTKTTCPVITSNPVGDTLCSGSSLTLSVTAVGANGFKWYKDGVFITGATNSIYTVSSATAANSGTYKVEAMPFTGASCGQIISPDVKVLVESTPVISAQPQGNTLCNPTSHTLTVTTSTTGHSYQWFKNGTAIAGANNASLNVSGLTSAGDKYFVQISGTGACPTVSSDTALLITRNPQNLVKLVTNSEQNLVEQCTDNNWTYYAKAGVPNEFLLAIRKNGNNVMFAPDIEINPAGIITLQHSANNPNGAILGRRFFNIDVISGALQYPYDVKFYYAPADTLEVMNKLAQLKAANANVTASRPSSSWITSTLVPFTSSLLSSVTSAPLSFANTIVSANSNGKDNNVDYVEITNLVAKNGGGTMFMDYTITSGSGIADRINKGFGIEMFPVPATTDLNVRLTSNTFKPVSFTITDMNGKVVMSSEERHQTNTTEHKFDISNLANGVYHIQLTNGETQSAAKFTVSK